MTFLSFFQQYWQHIRPEKQSVEEYNMAQIPLDRATNFSEDFSAVQWDHNQVTCQLNQRFSLIVKRCKQSIYILLRSGNKVIKLPFHIFDAICNSHFTVSYLKHFFRGNRNRSRVSMVVLLLWSPICDRNRL